MLVVKSSVKEYVAAKGLRTSQDLIDKLDEIIEEHLDKAIKRAIDNKRTTVQGRDL